MKQVLRLLLLFVLVLFLQTALSSIHAAPPPEPTANRTLRLDGSGDYVSIPHHADLSLTGLSAFTIEAWVRLDTNAGCHTIIGKDYQSAYWLGICDGLISFFSNNSGIDGTTVIPAELWTHIAVTWESGGQQHYYINGELERSSGALGGPTANSLPVFIGADSGPDPDLYELDGHTAGVRLWQVARSQNEIRRTMHLALRGPQTDLIANWNFNQDFDDNAHNHNGSPVGNALLSTAFDSPVEVAVTPVETQFNTLTTARRAAATVYIPTLDRALVIGGVTSGTTGQVTAVDAATGSPTALTPLPRPLLLSAAAYAPEQDAVYLFGGAQNSGPLSDPVDTIYRLNPVTGDATPLAATLPQALVDMTAVYHAGQQKIYLFGGYDGTTEVDTISIFDPASETLTTPAGWTLPTPLRRLSSSYSPATGDIYLFGGIGTTAVDHIYEVNLAAGGLTGAITLAPATLPRATHGMGAVLDPATQLIYLIGGRDNLYVMVFDPLTQELWQTPVGFEEQRRLPGVIFSPQNRHALLIAGDPGVADIWRIPLGDGPLVPLGHWDFPTPVASPVTDIDGEGGGVIVATDGSGAYRYFGDGSRLHYTPAMLGSAQVNDARYVAAQNHVWLATDSAGAKLDDGSSITTYDSSLLGSNQLLAIDTKPGYTELDQASFWGTFDQGLAWQRFFEIGPPLPGGFYAWVDNFDGLRVTALDHAAAGELYAIVGSVGNNTLRRLSYTITSGTETNFGNKCNLLNASDLLVSDIGDWWLTSPGAVEFGGEGICRVPAATTPGSGTNQEPLIGNEAMAVDQDADGRIWVGVTSNSDESGGAVAYEITGNTNNIIRTEEWNWLNAPLGDRIEITSDTAWDSGTSAVGAADERVWLGKGDGRLITLAQRWQQIDDQNGMNNRQIENVWTIRGRAFMATGSSLHVLMPDGLTWDNRNTPQVWDMLGDSQGNIWVATNTGPRLYTPTGWDLLASAAGTRPGTAIYALAEDKDGRIWLGGQSGLTLYDRDRFVATFTAADSGLPDDTIRTLLVDDDNNLWIGTDVGLVRFDGTNVWTTFTTADGLPHDAVFDLAQIGSGEIAISTNSGLSLYDDGSFASQSLPIPANRLPLSVDEMGRLWAGNVVRSGDAWRGYYWTNSGMRSDQVSDSAADGADRIWFGHSPETGVSVRGTYLPPLSDVVPNVTGITPTVGSAGDLITITGSGFGNRYTDVRASVGLNSAEVLSVSDTEIEVRLTARNTSGDVSVTVGRRRSTLTNSFCAIPIINSFSPTGGNDGVRVDIRGTNFDPGADIILGGTERFSHFVNPTHLWLDIMPSDGNGQLQVVNQCEGDTHTASGRDEFRRIELSVEAVKLNQGIEGQDLVANRPTLVQHYLSRSIAKRPTDEIEVDFVEVTFTEPGETADTYFQRYSGAVPITSGAPSPAQLADIVNSVNVTITPDRVDGEVNEADVTLIETVLKNNGHTLATSSLSRWIQPDYTIHVLLVPIMRPGYTPADLRTLQGNVGGSLDNLRQRIFPTGRLVFHWSPTVYEVGETQIDGSSTLDIGDTIDLYEASHSLDQARRYWNQTQDEQVLIAYGVVDNMVQRGTAGGQAFWPDIAQMLNVAGLDALDALCDVGDALLFVFSLGNAGGGGCDLEVPLYVGWGIDNADQSRLIGHELGHTMGLVKSYMSNGSPDDNPTHSVNDEIDGGECNELRAGTGSYNVSKTLYRQPGVAGSMVVNPLNPPARMQLRPRLSATATVGSGVTSSAVITRGKSLMSYACSRSGINSFFEPSDAGAIMTEYGLSGSVRTFTEIFPTRNGQPQARVPRRLPEPIPVAGKRIYVSGTVNQAGDTGELQQVKVLGDSAPLDLSYNTGYQLVQLDGGGNVLVETGVYPVFRTSDTGESDTGFFAATLLAEENVATIELRYEEAVLDSYTAGSAVPAVNISSPTGGDFSSGTIPVTWSSSDADGDDLTATVLFSADDGASWMPVAFAGGNDTVEIPVTELGGTENGRFQVVVSDGLNSASATSAPFAVSEQPPLPYISDALVDADVQFTEGVPILLSGGASDNLDGELSGESVRWHSDRDGELGTGNELYATLSVGEHLITLTAQNSSGQTAATSIPLTVVGDYDQDGLTDEEEQRMGLNLLDDYDAYEDEDGDGLPLIMEIRRNTDPKKADTDGDGRADDEEIGAGSDPLLVDSAPEPDQLAIYPQSLSFTADLATDNPLPQAQLQITSRETTDWTVTADVDWLLASRASGETVDGVTILAQADELGNGTHSATLTFTSQSLGDTVTVPVTVTVSGSDEDVNLYLPLMVR